MLAPDAARQPVLFLGHGSPMNAIEDNRWSRAFVALGKSLHAPRAVVCISAHWFIEETSVTANPRPKTIHDLGGFPRELFEVQYPAPGDVELAAKVATLLGGKASLSRDWGLDHGTWSVLRHLRPEADLPVIQLSIDSNKSAADHLAIGKQLRDLREQGVLIAGSGNVTHNLRHAMTAMRSGETEIPAWAARFDRDLTTAIGQRDDQFLIKALGTSDGRMSHPSPDHFLPLLYAYGASDERDVASSPIEGFDLSSLSMRTVQWVAKA
jgi:4,5-DOPA dioxygenase extradiol